MPRTALTVKPLVSGGSVTPLATYYVAADAANGMEVVLGREESLFIHVKNADAAAKTVTVVAGDKRWDGAIYTNLTVTVAATSEAFIGPLPSHKYAQIDGKVQLNFSAATSTTVAAFRIPKGALS